MKIDVYGIPESVGRCYGCRRVKGLLDDLGFIYTFIPVMQSVSDKPSYDRPAIEKLASRMGQTSLNIAYPVIFIDDVRVRNFNDFKDLLLLNNADPSIIQDYS